MLLVVEKAVMLVDNLPESLKVALCRIGEFLLIDAGLDQGRESQQG
jgi:hypothetical protein